MSAVETTDKPPSYIVPEINKILERLRAEIAASTSPASLARRTLKTEGEIMLAYALVQYLEMACTGKVYTVEPPRHHA